MYSHRYCSCEDYPCCGHTDDDGSTDMTDAEIKQAVYDSLTDDDYQGEED